MMDERNLVWLLIGFNNLALLCFVSLYCYDIYWQKKCLLQSEEYANNEANKKDVADDIVPNQWYAWLIGISICLDIWAIGAVATHWWADKFFLEIKEEDNRKALFGDSFGAVNALISAYSRDKVSLRCISLEVRDESLEIFLPCDSRAILMCVWMARLMLLSRHCGLQGLRSGT